MTKSEQIQEKCEQAGCNEAAKKRHHQLFVFERWDVHPPPDFRVWYGENGPGPDHYGKPANPISGWNTDSVRQEFYKSRAPTQETQRRIREGFMAEGDPLPF